MEIDSVLKTFLMQNEVKKQSLSVEAKKSKPYIRVQNMCANWSCVSISINDTIHVK
jgi:hypothetical protein